jgi:hypothetical protein
MDEPSEPQQGVLPLKVAPPGWRCSAIGDYTGLAKLGQCLNKSAIIEWLPKLKK